MDPWEAKTRAPARRGPGNESSYRRYRIFQRICIQKQFGVLLVAHHSGDQAELFLIRLSRNSSVLGLAGMAFTSELFSRYTHSHVEDSDHGILLVRPLLDFSKEDLYEICRIDKQKWVEDPSNRSSSYARNRIRMSLQSFPSTSTFMSELLALISTCRRTRSYVEKTCSNLITRSLTVTDLGYAIIDLPALEASSVDDISLVKFLAVVVQFISQRHRPVRGSTSKLLLEYVRTFPCKTSLTAAGCYLSPAPGSKGTKVLVCCSANLPMPSKVELHSLRARVEEPNHLISEELEGVVNLARLYSDLHCPKASDVQFLDSSSSVLCEAKRLNIIGESTYKIILSIQEEEMKLFNSDQDSHHELKKSAESVGTPQTDLLQPGMMGNFMNRFLIWWRWADKFDNGNCTLCHTQHNMVAAEVRLMKESDWLYLSRLSKCGSSGESLAEYFSDHVRLSAGQSRGLLKHIPAPARRSLPVLVDSSGLLLSIPILNFKHCPGLEVLCKFRPRVPLGGGHSSFI
ncbi:hypothetical protein SAY87_022911 [Trapa incisa]|uniref:tRNA(Ile)-lysidine synthetase n=1 Tax=Trapa incisa TaxID=236973 RepID=A0AAN7K3F9_9MYRT|nr:hypothetical protein SAY87_022911 [Trapa incisa]